MFAAVYERRTGQAKQTTVRRRGTGFVFLILLLFLFSPLSLTGPLAETYFVTSAITKTLGVLLTAAGVGFAIWARRYLGGNWSGTPSLKKGHTLVTGGPYSIVRHPIYTGILAGVVGSTLVLGTYSSLLVIALTLAVLLVRVRQEEGLMLGQFGDEYREYQRRVKRIIPLVW